MNIIEVRGVTKDYALGKTLVHALRGVDLDIAKGDLVSFMGSSGSGKTTLLNIIGCIDRPSAGRIRDGFSFGAYEHIRANARAADYVAMARNYLNVRVERGQRLSGRVPEAA